jgi:nucleoside-diphosphate-sugar epimerase
MKVLITGTSGFTGNHMISYLAKTDKRYELFGLFKSNVKITPIECNFIKCDLTCGDMVDSIISEIEPEIIINLAGKNHGTLEELLTINVIGTKNLLNAAHNLNKKPRVLIIGSSAEYGYSGTKPISENAPVNPISEYGISKLSSTFLSLNYHKSKGLPVTVIRPFNLLGPGQPETFVCGRLVKQICKIGNIPSSSISLSRINSRRDFIDVRDAVRAFWMVISHPHFEKKCAGNIFNLGSGKAHSVAEIFNCICSIKNQKYSTTILHDGIPELIPTQICDHTYLTKTTGWLPSISFEKSLQDMVFSEEQIFQE